MTRTTERSSTRSSKTSSSRSSKSSKPTPSRSTKSSTTEPCDSIYDLELIGQGGTGLVFKVNDRSVIKVPITSSFGLQAIERERQIYRRLRKRPSNYVVQCLDAEHRSGLFLERCIGTVRGRLRQMLSGGSAFPKINSDDALDLAGRWAYQAAEGLAHIHRYNIIQADVGCHNMLLDQEGNLKLADFSGSSMTDKPDSQALIIYDIRSRMPNVYEPDHASDMFALGSAIYEMVTGHLPYPTLAEKEVQRLFYQRRFPELDRLELFKSIANAIRGCWLVNTEGGFISAKDVANELRKTVEKEGITVKTMTEEIHAIIRGLVIAAKGTATSKKRKTFPS
ncbi:proliferating cell nuclear antigen [Apiospora arundinis]